MSMRATSGGRGVPPVGDHGQDALFPFRDETDTLTEAIASVEREIDERVAGLYGV